MPGASGEDLLQPEIVRAVEINLREGEGTREAGLRERTYNNDKNTPEPAQAFSDRAGFAGG